MNFNIFNSAKKTESPQPSTPVERAEARIDAAHAARFPTPPIPQDEAAARLEVNAKAKTPPPPTDRFLLPPYKGAHVPNFTMEKLHAHARKACGVKSLLDKSEREQQEALDVKYRKLTQDLCDNTDNAIRDVFRKQLIYGDHTGEVSTKDRMLEEAAIRRRQIKAARKEIVRQATEIASVPFERFQQKLRDFCEARDKAERYEAADIGIEFHPSPELVVLVHYLKGLRAYLAIDNATPAVVLAHFS